MRNFQTKWRVLARQARQTAPREETPPFGFATRVLAHAAPESQPGGPEIWGRVALRLLGVVIPLLVICAFLEGRHLRRAPSLDAGVENTVAQIVWRL